MLAPPPTPPTSPTSRGSRVRVPVTVLLVLLVALTGSLALTPSASASAAGYDIWVRSSPAPVGEPIELTLGRPSESYAPSLAVTVSIWTPDLDRLVGEYETTTNYQDFVIRPTPPLPAGQYVARTSFEDGWEERDPAPFEVVDDALAPAVTVDGAVLWNDDLDLGVSARFEQGGTPTRNPTARGELLITPAGATDIVQAWAPGTGQQLLGAWVIPTDDVDTTLTPLQHGRWPRCTDSTCPQPGDYEARYAVTRSDMDPVVSAPAGFTVEARETQVFVTGTPSTPVELGTKVTLTATAEDETHAMQRTYGGFTFTDVASDEVLNTDGAATVELTGTDSGRQRIEVVWAPEPGFTGELPSEPATVDIQWYSGEGRVEAKDIAPGEDAVFATSIDPLTGATRATVSVGGGDVHVLDPEGKATIRVPNLAEGTHPWTVTWYRADQTEVTSTTGVLTVAKRTQTITFDPPGSAWAGDSIALAASSDAELPVGLAVETPDVCALSGTTLRLTGPGECAVTATQPGDAQHGAATPVTASIEVRQAQVRLTATVTPDEVFVADPVAISATATNATRDAAPPDAPVPGSYLVRVDGAREELTGEAGSLAHDWVPTAAGTYTVEVVFTPSSKRFGAPAPQTFEVTVRKAATELTLTASTSTVSAGQSVTWTAHATSLGAQVAGVVIFSSGKEILAERVTSNGRASWTSPTLRAGTHSVSAAFRPTNTDRHESATAAAQHVVVTKNPSEAHLRAQATTLPFGEEFTVNASGLVAGGPAGGTIELTVDGDLHRRATLTQDDPSIAVTVAGLAPGPHRLVARLHPDDQDFDSSTSEPLELTVSHVETATTVSVQGRLATVAVAPVAPGRAVPIGRVRLSVAGTPVRTVDLVGGTATVTLDADPDGRVVAAEYLPGTGFLASSTSMDVPGKPAPGISATVTSTGAKKKTGWYRTPVTVTFTCEPHGATLVGACPAPVTLRHGDAQSVTRTIRTTAGGVATASVSGIRVDTRAPRVRLRGLAGIRRTRHLTAPAAPTCAASDATSGVTKCTVKTRRKGSKVTWTAKAVDRAGNVRTTTASIRLVKARVAGARVRNGVTRVRAGQAYRLEVRAKKQPVHLLPTPAPGKPTVAATQQLTRVGPKRWAVTVRFEQAMANGRTYALGARAGRKTLTVPVKVSR